MSDEEKLDPEKEARVQEHETREQDNKNKHNLMLKGKAESLIIKTNAAEGENFSNPDDPKNKKKKDRDIYDRILRDLINDIDENLKQIRGQIKATNKLKELMKKNELDYDNPEHIILIHQAGLTEDYVKENGMQGLNDHTENLKGKEQDYLQQKADLKDLENRFESNPKDQSIQAEIEEKLQNTKADQQKVANAIVSDADLENISGVNMDEFSFTSDQTISAASEFDPEGSISSLTTKTAFNNAASGDVQANNKPIATVAPAEAPTLS